MNKSFNMSVGKRIRLLAAGVDAEIEMNTSMDECREVAQQIDYEGFRYKF